MVFAAVSRVGARNVGVQSLGQEDTVQGDAFEPMG